MREEGVTSLYNGLVPGLLRQTFFASIRLGTYEPVKQFYIQMLNANPDSMNVSIRILAGITTGALGVCVGQPTDVLKVRFQAQTKHNAKFSFILKIIFKRLIKIFDFL